MLVPFLLQEMRNTEHPLALRLDIAKSVAPYCSPRLSSVELVKSIKLMSVDELKFLIRDFESVIIPGEPLRLIPGGRS